MGIIDGCDVLRLLEADNVFLRDNDGCERQFGGRAVQMTRIGWCMLFLLSWAVVFDDIVEPLFSLLVEA